jgi:hypothetical protein
VLVKLRRDDGLGLEIPGRPRLYEEPTEGRGGGVQVGKVLADLGLQGPARRGQLNAWSPVQGGPARGGGERRRSLTTARPSGGADDSAPGFPLWT